MSQAALIYSLSDPHSPYMGSIPGGVPLTIDPAEPYKVRPMKPADADPQPEAQPDILQDFRDAGDWLAVSTRTVEKIVDMCMATGEPMPEEIALMDLHYWIDKGQVKPFRYYAKRWKWGEKKVRLMFERLGLLGAQQGHKEGTNGAQESKNPEQKEASGAQVGHSKGTTGAQYYQTQTTDSENTGGGKRARGESATKQGEPEMPVKDNPPTVEQVIEYGQIDGVPERECRDCFDHYTGLGWRTSSGAIIYDWRAILRKWHVTEKSRRASTNGNSGARRGGGV